MQRRKFHHSNIIRDRWLSCCNTSFSISQKLQDPDSNGGGPGASGFWLGPMSPCKLPTEDTSKAVGCHVIWSILLQMGWGFKIMIPCNEQLGNRESATPGPAHWETVAESGIKPMAPKTQTSGWATGSLLSLSCNCPSWGSASSLPYQNPTGRVDFQNIPARRTEAMLGLVPGTQKVLSLPRQSFCATLAGRAQGSCSCFSLPSISFLSQTIETQAVQFPSSCTKIDPTPLKNTTIPFHVQSKRRRAQQPIRLSVSQLRRCNVKLKCTVPWMGKHWAGPVHQKELAAAVTMCSLWFPRAPLKQWQSAHSVVELKWRWVSNAPMSNVHCAPSHSGASQKQENKNHIPPCLNEWGTGRWFPDISDPLTLSLQADHSINLIFIWCNISRIPSCLYYSEDCISSSNHIIALGMCVQLDIHHKHCLLHSHHLWEKAFPFFAFPFCSERIWS